MKISVGLLFKFHASDITCWIKIGQRHSALQRDILKEQLKNWIAEKLISWKDEKLLQSLMAQMESLILN